MIRNKERGITLIALVITIIVMLILAGVTINLTLGENGIFTTAKTAAKNYTDAQNKELSELDEFTNLLNDTINGLGNTNSNNNKDNSEDNDEKNEETEIKLNSWSSKNKVNMPKLENTGLTPVTINTDGTYENVDTQKEDWYSYDGTTNKWANAKTKDGSMWVWIPRFAYKITYTHTSDKSKGGTIDVVFLQNTTNKDSNGNDVTSESYVDENGKTGAYIVHPAFQDGSSTGYTNGEWDKEIEGFWMAKFEAGYVGNAGDATSAVDSNVAYSTIYSWNRGNIGDLESNYYGTREVGTKIKYPTFQANRASMNYIGISDAYDLCRSIQNASSVYGLSNTDSHMTKNSEWGAVAYLTHSKYGRNGEEITINNITLSNSINTAYAVTGYAGETTNANAVATTWEKVQNGTQAGSWTTEQGQKASTTGNIYGIYDLSGGLWEWTSGYITTEGNYETYGGSLKGESNKYKTKYVYSGTGETESSNYSVTENQNRKGDAIAEISTTGLGNTSWNEEYSYFPYTTMPFSIRGGEWVNNSGAGIFAFLREYGYCNVALGFRAVLVSE